MPYTVWVIDEMKVDLEAVIELPMARWDVEYVKLSQFQVLRCRSIGNVTCNIAWHLCLRQQASGADIIRLFRNAVLGQPPVDCVEPSMQYEEGAGFPQNVFEQLRFAVPVLIYLDNSLAHLFNALQTLLQRLANGLSRHQDEEPAAHYQAPQPVAPQAPRPQAPHPDMARRPQAPVHRHAQGQFDAQGRAPAQQPRGLEDDQLEIPAFLRRQAN